MGRKTRKVSRKVSRRKSNNHKIKVHRRKTRRTRGGFRWGLGQMSRKTRYMRGGGWGLFTKQEN